MIDDLPTTEALLQRMRAALPIAALLTAHLRAALREPGSGVLPPSRCRIVGADYAGDEGGIVCALEFDRSDADRRRFFVSLTHLTVERRNPLYRPIRDYQRRRVARLSRQHRAAS